LKEIFSVSVDCKGIFEYFWLPVEFIYTHT